MKHISAQDVYNIEMALLRNYGYLARRVDLGDDDDPQIEVVDDSDRVVVTITVSPDGSDWVIARTGAEPVVRPLRTPLSEIAETIVAELERPQ